MIFIVVNFPVKPEFADQWPQLTAAFTAGTQAEAGNLWFYWSRAVEDPNLYVLVEAFRDDAAAVAHVQSAHFTGAMRDLKQYLTATPRIVNTVIEGEDWSLMGELAVD